MSLVKRAENQTLNVQDDVGDVLDYALSGGELVLYTLDLDSGRLRAVRETKAERDACSCPSV